MTKIEIIRLNAAISKSVAGMRPPENLTVTQWADKYRRLSIESSAEPGRWRTSRTPYLKEIMDAFKQHDVRNIVVWASSQVGKSECLNNMIGYIIDQDPGSILFVHPTTLDAKEYSELRLRTMIRDTKRLRNKISPEKSRDKKNTILQKTYPGGVLTVCGSQEAHSLASKPIRYLFGDERDRWAISAGNEGDPWELAKKRQLTFYNSKSVEVSTPTIKGVSNIERAFKSGTMEHYCSECPHCHDYSEIKFADIRFTKNEKEVNGVSNFEITNIFWICPKCGATSTEAEIKKQPAKWIAENPGQLKETKTRSFKLTSFVSPWVTWTHSIREYLKSIGNTKMMQVVVNTLFGEVFEDRGQIEDEGTIMARREIYDAEVPDGVLLLTCGVDTQDDRFEYEVVGHGHFGETWGIKKGVILGRPDAEETWKELDSVIDHVYQYKNGVGIKIRLTFMDEGGHFTQSVRKHCRDRIGKRLFAIKGVGGESVPFTSPPKQQKIVLNGKSIGQCYVYNIGVDAGKQIIMDNLKVIEPGNHYCHFPLNDNYGKDYFKGLLSEKLVYKPTKNSKYQWVKLPGHERNEALDCRNYAIAAERSLDPDYDELANLLRCATEQKLNGIAKNKKVTQPKKEIKRKPRKRSSFGESDGW